MNVFFFFFTSFWWVVLIFGWIVYSFHGGFVFLWVEMPLHPLCKLPRCAPDGQLDLHPLMVLLTKPAEGPLTRDLFIFPLYYSLDYMSVFIKLNICTLIYTWQLRIKGFRAREMTNGSIFFRLCLVCSDSAIGCVFSQVERVCVTTPTAMLSQAPPATFHHPFIQLALTVYFFPHLLSPVYATCLKSAGVASNRFSV